MGLLEGIDAEMHEISSALAYGTTDVPRANGRDITTSDAYQQALMESGSLAGSLVEDNVTSVPEALTRSVTDYGSAAADVATEGLKEAGINPSDLANLGGEIASLVGWSLADQEYNRLANVGSNVYEGAKSGIEGIANIGATVLSRI